MRDLLDLAEQWTDRFLRPRYCDRGRWKNWSSGKIRWQVPRETIEEGDHVIDFAILEFCSQLHASHDPDRFRKRRYRPIMEVWGRHSDVPQACYSEYVQISRILGHVGPTLIDGLAAGGDPIVF